MPAVHRGQRGPGDAAVHGAVVGAGLAHGVALHVVHEPDVVDGDVAVVDHARPGGAAVVGAVDAAVHMAAAHQMGGGVEAPRAADGDGGTVGRAAGEEAIGGAREGTVAAAEAARTVRCHVYAQAAVARLAPRAATICGAHQSAFQPAVGLPAHCHAHLVVLEGHFVEHGVPSALLHQRPRLPEVAAGLEAAVGAQQHAAAGGHGHAAVLGVDQLLHGPGEAGIGAAHHAAVRAAGHQHVALCGQVQHGVSGEGRDLLPGGAAVGGADHVAGGAHAHAGLRVEEVDVMHHQLDVHRAHHRPGLSTVHALDHPAAEATGVAGIGVQELDVCDVVAGRQSAFHQLPARAAVGAAQDLAGLGADPPERVVEEEHGAVVPVARRGGHGGGGEAVVGAHHQAQFTSGDAAQLVPHEHGHGVVEMVLIRPRPAVAAIDGAHDGAHGLVGGVCHQVVHHVDVVELAAGLDGRGELPLGVGGEGGQEEEANGGERFHAVAM